MTATRSTIVGSSFNLYAAVNGTPGLYRASARYLETHGWQRGTLLADEDGPACAVGSVYKTSAEMGFLRVQLSPFLQFLHLKTLDELYAWNDAPERTAEEVIKTFYAFADYLEEQEKR